MVRINFPSERCRNKIPLEIRLEYGYRLHRIIWRISDPRCQRRLAKVDRADTGFAVRSGCVPAGAACGGSLLAARSTRFWYASTTGATALYDSVHVWRPLSLLRHDNVLVAFHTRAHDPIIHGELGRNAYGNTGEYLHAVAVGLRIERTMDCSDTSSWVRPAVFDNRCRGRVGRLGCPLLDPVSTSDSLITMRNTNGSRLAMEEAEYPEIRGKMGRSCGAAGGPKSEVTRQGSTHEGS